MADAQSCPVCSKIMGIFRAWQEKPNKDASAELGQVSLIIDMPCPHADSIRQMWEALSGDDSPQRWTAGIKYEHMEENVHFVINYDGREEEQEWVPVGLVRRPDVPGHAGISRALDPEWADVSVLRGWYDACVSGHGRHCQEPAVVRVVPGGLATPSWLVDAVDECIVPFGPATARYLTLSYTWGRVDCLKHTDGNIEQLRRRGALCPASAPMIPRTVRDAMGVTVLLGERYLWVDSLCINQDSAASSKDLHVMHHIYAGSAICLVAMAGTDAAHGLRGIKGVSCEPRDANQVVLDIADGERLGWTQWPPGSFPVREDDARQGSSYEERGWTFQEYMFAPRRLMFTDGPLRWICNTSESGEESLERLTRTDFGGMNVPGTKWLRDQDPALGAVGSAARRYNTRYFTFEADALTGFLGIQTHLEAIQPCLGRLNYGHPEMFFDISLAWRSSAESGYSGMTRRLDRPEIKSDRPSPPTWSWMGWRGEFGFPVDSEFHGLLYGKHDGFTESVAQWFAMRSPQSMATERRPINCTWHQYKMLAMDKASKPLEGWNAHTKDGLEVYTRVAAAKTERDDLGLRYRYAVPLRPETVKLEPLEQLPFLFARTSRCFFDVGKPYREPPSEKKPSRRQHDHLVELSCRDGRFAGFMSLHLPSDLSGILASEVVELVAVAKGWTKSLASLFEGFRGGDWRAWAGAQNPKAPYEAKITPAEDTRLDCYFVLCVEWENGVARRRSSGMVATEIWERYKEPVDLILG